MCLEFVRIACSMAQSHTRFGCVGCWYCGVLGLGPYPVVAFLLAVPWGPTPLVSGGCHIIIITCAHSLPPSLSLSLFLPSCAPARTRSMCAQQPPSAAGSGKHEQGCRGGPQLRRCNVLGICTDTPCSRCCGVRQSLKDGLLLLWLWRLRAVCACCFFGLASLFVEHCLLCMCVGGVVCMYVRTMPACPVTCHGCFVCCADGVPTRAAGWTRGCFRCPRPNAQRGCLLPRSWRSVGVGSLCGAATRTCHHSMPP